MYLYNMKKNYSCLDPPFGHILVASLHHTYTYNISVSIFNVSCMYCYTYKT